jgi:hypothetical protein
VLRNLYTLKDIRWRCASNSASGIPGNALSNMRTARRLSWALAMVVVGDGSLLSILSTSSRSEASEGGLVGLDILGCCWVWVGKWKSFKKMLVLDDCSGEIKGDCRDLFNIDSRQNEI